MPHLQGKRVTVMGLGLFQGGVEVTRFLVGRGAQVTVTDLKPADHLQPAIKALQGLPLCWVLGEHREADFIETDLVIVNQAVPDRSPYLKLAIAHGIHLETETNLFFKLCPASIVGVSGSNGKTTTTCLLGAIFQAYDRCTRVGGNLGVPLLNEVESIPADGVVILELSSFQLHRLGWLGVSPQLAVVTNIAPNHLDWHGTLEAYVAAKQEIVRYQCRSDRVVLNWDDPILRTWASRCPGEVYWFSLQEAVEQGVFLRGDTLVLRRDGQEIPICSRAQIPLPGRHNLANAAAAVTAASVYGLPAETIASAVASFRGVPHRLERVAEVAGVGYYNDSAATTPESTMVALEAFAEPIHLIAGGYDKGVAFDKLADVMVRRAKTVLLIGATAARIEAAVKGTGGGLDLFRCRDLASAVERARDLARPGEVVVLSPACASYDQFANFEERGNRFRALVNQLSIDN